MNTPSKERRILFCDAMVRAILDGRKTQTRRIVHRNHSWTVNKNGVPVKGFHGPYGVSGQRLLVCEAWQHMDYPNDLKSSKNRVFYRADYLNEAHDEFTEKNPNWRWRSSLYMPLSVSRIALEIVNVRMERLQDISETDAQAEGAKYLESESHMHSGGWSHDERNHYPTARESFRALWNQIHGVDGWSANPRVWVIEFQRMQR